ncbi:UDPGP type 1 family protein [Thermostilla marina]
MGNTDKQQLLGKLEKHGQEHLLAFWDQLDVQQRDSLAAQIAEVDFDLIARLYANRDAVVDVAGLLAQATSPRAVRLGRPSEYSPEEARRRGEQALAAGEVAALLVAGGQGTRLGFPHPKGMFEIGPVSNRTLFQIHVEKIRARSRRYGKPIPLALMTSPATNDETIAFFAEHERFGLPVDDLLVFCQGTMPAVDAQTGKLLLAAPDRLAVSPDGHGGMLAALVKSGTMEKLRSRGIRYLFYFQVDNPLVDIAAPEVIGYHLLSGSEMTTEVVAKKTPLDRVGNVVQVGDRLHVIEYSDLPDELARRTAEDGSLLLWAGSIGVHVINLDFLARMSDLAEALPFHIARKKVPYVDLQGQAHKPESPNAIKFERFIFDLIPQAENAIVVEVDAAEHFAPLKNAPGAAEDTPEAVREAIVAFYRKWLEAAGAEVADGVAVEVSPLFALDVDELRTKLPAGTKVVEPTYFA